MKLFSGEVIVKIKEIRDFSYVSIGVYCKVTRIKNQLISSIFKWVSFHVSIGVRFNLLVYVCYEMRLLCFSFLGDLLYYNRFRP